MAEIKSSYVYAVEVDVMSEGKKLDTKFMLRSIEVGKYINKLPYAVIRLREIVGDKGKLELSDTKTLAPGSAIEIKAGGDGKLKTIFKGIIVKQGLQLADGDAEIIIECTDKAVALTTTKKNAVFQKKKDSDIIQQVVKDAGLKVKCKATKVKHPEVVQYYSSDWDFVLNLADVNGMFVLISDGELDVKEMAMSGKEYDLLYNHDLISCKIEIDASKQIDKSEAFAWDMGKQKIVKSSGESFKDASKVGSDLDTKKLSKVSGGKNFIMQTPIPATVEELKAWASAKIAKSSLAKYKGTVTVKGFADIEAGDVLNLKEIGARFKGKVLVSGVEHTIEDANWETTLILGTDFEWATEQLENVHVESTSGLLPGVHGLQTGVVKQIHEDEEGQFRIKVALPLLQKDNMGLWARMAHFYASNGIGAFFLPEVNDEVVVGFLNEDPRFPVILGMLYSKKNKAPLTPEKDNPMKSLVTKSKMELNFNDKDKIIEVKTPGKNSITISDKDKSITIEDQNKNKITMSKDGIVIESGKDFVVKAKGKVSIDAGMAMEVKAKQAIKAEGLEIGLKAKTKLAAEGSAQAEFKSGGQTVVKGAMVMLN